MNTNTSDKKQLVNSIVGAVEDIKDPELKKLAFDKLLTHELQARIPVKESKVSPQGVEKTKKHKRTVPSGKRNNYSKASIRDEVTKLELSGVEPNSIPWTETRLAYVKYLWILKVAKDRDIDGLTNAEIAYLILEKLREPATEKSVNNLKLKVKDGLVSSLIIEGKQAWKLLSKGEALVLKEG